MKIVTDTINCVGDIGASDSQILETTNNTPVLSAYSEESNEPSVAESLSILDMGVETVLQLNIPARCKRSREYFFWSKSIRMMSNLKPKKVMYLAQVFDSKISTQGSNDGSSSSSR
jgi:hypothetical protein